MGARTWCPKLSRAAAGALEEALVLRSERQPLRLGRRELRRLRLGDGGHVGREVVLVAANGGRMGRKVVHVAAGGGLGRGGLGRGGRGRGGSRGGGSAGGRDWIGLFLNDSYFVTGVRQISLLPAIAVLILLIGGLMFSWYREGR